LTRWRVLRALDITPMPVVISYVDNVIVLAWDLVALDDGGKILGDAGRRSSKRFYRRPDETHIGRDIFDVHCQCFCCVVGVQDGKKDEFRVRAKSGRFASATGP
jgi:hypothetical protein